MHLNPLADNEAIPLIAQFDPDKIIVFRGSLSVTQGEFLEDVCRIAKAFHSRSSIVNLCDDRYHFMVVFSAALVAGVANLLPPNKLPATLEELIQSYSDTLVVDDQEFKALYTTHSSAVSEINNLPVIPAQQIAAVAFTSGSTGKALPYEKHWGTLAATARLLGKKLVTTQEQICLLATVPSQHMYGLETTIMMPLQAGLCLDSAKPFFPKDIEHRLRDIPNPVLLVSSPLHLRAMVQSELPMPVLAGIISATALLDLEIARQCEQVFAAPLYEIYGCTEVGSMAVRQSLKTQDWELLSGFQLEVAEDAVTASAPHLSECFSLQDRLDLLSPSHFRLAGRRTDMINVAGKRTSLANLNTHLLRINGVQDGIIFLPENQQGECRPVAMVVSHLDEKTILAEMAQQVDAAFLPRPLRKVDCLPRSETGKLQSALVQQLWRQINGQ